MSDPGHRNAAVSLPRGLASALAMLPDGLHSRLMASALNHLLARWINTKDLDFLDSRGVVIAVRDMGIRYRLSCKQGRLIAWDLPADLTIEATLYDYLQLIGKQEDPDTLVFQRRLSMRGDTELGLAVKNFLDGLDFDSLGSYRKLDLLLQRVLPVYKRIFGQVATRSPDP